MLTAHVRNAGASTARTELQQAINSCESGNHSSGRNRSVWFIGNSVTRHHFFAAIALLKSRDPSAVDFVEDRKQQIQVCGRGGQWKGHRPGQGLCYGPCSCSQTLPWMDGLSFVRLVFVWQQKNFDGYLSDLLVDAAARRKYALLEGSPGPGDLVLVNVGLDGVADTLKRGLTNKRLSRAEVREGPRNLTRFLKRWRDQLPSQAANLAAAMQNAQRAKMRVIFRATSAICPTAKEPDQWGHVPISTVNGYLAESDLTFRAAFAQRSVPFFDMLGADVEDGCKDAVRVTASVRANRNTSIACACRNYADSLHPTGPRGARQLAELARFACDAYPSRLESQPRPTARLPRV